MQILLPVLARSPKLLSQTSFNAFSSAGHQPRAPRQLTPCHWVSLPSFPVGQKHNSAFMCKLFLCNQKTMVKSVGALFGYLLRWSLLRSACFLSTPLEASKLSQTSIEQCVCKLSFAKNANICVFLWREPITITTTRSSSFFDLCIAGHYRLSGLPSPMVYSLDTDTEGCPKNTH